uniref:KHA domain-containing protein n=1 Tax=Rhinopithecus bieti TaxID=61621 RepID=A0A2K6JMX8_RHIBE
MRWVTVFLNGSPENRKVVAVYGTLSDLLSVVSSKLSIKATSVYNGKGGLIDNIALIRDDDPFIDSQTDSKPPEGLSGFHTDWLTLNVGGRYFTTTQSTLVNKDPDSMLAHVFKDKGLIVNDGIHLLDVLEEARFFGICLILLATPTKSELRCQGLNFSGADLSRLDLRYINFKTANLSCCSVAHANLCCLSLEQADLSGSVLDCANLQGVKILCSNVEGASLKLCNFEDPSGLKASLEGANLKGVDMEESHVTGINLRVATLKNATLKNCNLRGATLAGTDLENCDLSGCDLQEGARFEEMLTPLHMSQSVR